MPHEEEILRLSKMVVGLERMYRGLMDQHIDDSMRLAALSTVIGQLLPEFAGNTPLVARIQAALEVVGESTGVAGNPKMAEAWQRAAAEINLALPQQ